MESKSQFHRRFVCRECEVDATLEVIAKGILAVECPKCGATELWGHEATMLEAPEYFVIYPAADC